MFVRRTQTGSSPRGPRFSHRLCKSVRSGSKVRQINLLNLGADFPIPKHRWHEFAALVQSIDDGAPLLFEPEPDLLPLARDIARRLRRRREAAALDTSPSGQPVATVLLRSFEHPPTRSVGAERIALAALDALRFPDILTRQGFSPREVSLASALVLARMLHPSSEREASRWLNQSSSAWQLLGIDSCKPPSLNSLYRIGDRLWQSRAGLETDLANRQRTLFEGPRRALAFYDLTNVHTFGKARGDRQFGRSKQRRSDCPLVTLALSIDEDGFPRCSEVLPGNVSEPATLKAAIERLEARSPADGGPLPLVIMDAGICSQANLDWLRKRGYDWITVQRGKRAERPAESQPACFETRGGVQAKAWEVSQSGAREKLVCVWTEARQAHQAALQERARERFEKDLQGLHAGLHRKGCLKQYERVVEKLGRLKETHKRVASQYEVQVQAAPKGSDAAKKGHAVAVRWQLNGKGIERDDRVGTYELRTSCADWDLEEIVRTYWRLAEIEATFRALKSEMGLRPVWHRKRERIRAHLFVAVLACHAVHLLRRKLALAGICDSWATIRNKLAHWDRVTTRVRTVDGRLIENCQDTTPGREAVEIAKALGVQPQLHRKQI